ncbi:MAG: hypothetical protein M0D57_04960 [Sphingobacteriales bacterium JAD_PAG50586_3]|nr:MAG: hypothetical protein M0D57_04960 [Sphingobacteriales bacterium JAD_PAG50586_3]
MITEKEALKSIGDRLATLRIGKGYSSYEAFAIEFELSRMQYWRMETGKANLTIRSLVTVLNIHEITFEDFFKIKAEPQVKESSKKQKSKQK